MKLWLAWVLATTLAFGVGGRLGAALSSSNDLIVVGYFAVTTSLLLAGAAQWVVLRRRIAQSVWWVPVNIAAAALIGLLVFGVGLLHRDVGWVVGLVVGWIVLGLLQWLVLRKQVERAGWWPSANGLGLIAAIPAVGLMTWATAMPPDDPLGGLFRWLAFGAAYGAITGTALWWLLRLPVLR